MSYTPYNAPILSGLFGDVEIASLFSVKSDIQAMLQFETSLALSQANCELIPTESAAVIAQSCKAFTPDIAAITNGVQRDGLAMPELVHQLRQHIGEPHNEFLHFGATSQDLVDTSLILRLRDIITIYEMRLNRICDQLKTLNDKFGVETMMGRTRMQAAIPIKVSDRLRIWKQPLEEHKIRLNALKPNLLKLQFGGAVGTLDKLGDKGKTISTELAKQLNLNHADTNWHTDRSSIADFCHWLSLVTGTLGKTGQDLALMAQQGIAEVTFSGSGGSSAMPHKQNPVKAEALVTLARFNAVQLSGIHQALVHEQERSGTAWSLEWMIVPQMCVATGAALNLAITLTDSITHLGGDRD